MLIDEERLRETVIIKKVNQIDTQYHIFKFMNLYS